MTSDSESTAEPFAPLTRLLIAAQSGLRRDVQALLESLDDSELLVPLARDLPDAPLGERLELTGELTLVPHLLPDSEGQLFSALFSRPDPMEPIVTALEWTTDGELLKVCSFPTRIALQMAHDVIDEQNVLGLVIDPGSDSELCLTRAELGSILGGRAVPLLAYVGQIPADEREQTLLADPGEPPPVELTSLLDAWSAEQAEVIGYRLERTFNPDRDLEPHLSLALQVRSAADRTQLFQSVTAALEDRVPPPGYLDVLFEEQ